MDFRTLWILSTFLLSPSSVQMELSSIKRFLFVIGGKCYFTEGSLIICLSGSMLTVPLPLASTALQREPLVPQGCSQQT